MLIQWEENSQRWLGTHEITVTMRLIHNLKRVILMEMALDTMSMKT